MCECLAALWELDRAGVCIEIRGGYLLLEDCEYDKWVAGYGSPEQYLTHHDVNDYGTDPAKILILGTDDQPATIEAIITATVARWHLLYDGMPDSLPRPNFAHNPTAGG